MQEDETFDEFVIRKWTNAHDKGICQYKLKTMCKRVDGNCGFIIQLNSQRTQNRRSPQTFTSVNMPFNEKKFNFTKIKPQEILFKMDMSNDDVKVVEGDEHSYLVSANDTLCDVSIINVSPFAVGHMLLVPRLSDCRQQILTKDAVKLALQLQLMSKSPKYITVYNSMCAQASVNHLHLHSYYLNIEGDMDLMESPNLLIQKPLPASKKLSQNCYLCEDLPVPAFLFQVNCKEEINEIVKEIIAIVDYFVKNNTAHNMSLVKGAPIHLLHESGPSKNFTPVIRVYLWPRNLVVGNKHVDRTNVGACELSGHLFVSNQMYNSTNQSELLKLYEDILLPENVFADVLMNVQKIINK